MNYYKVADGGRRRTNRRTNRRGMKGGNSCNPPDCERSYT